MIWTSFQFLIVMWMLGMATGHTFGGMIHILLLMAVVSVAIHLISGRLTQLRSRP